MVRSEPEPRASIPRKVLLAFKALARAEGDEIVKTIRGVAAAIIVGGGLIVSGQSFALCSLPPGAGPTTPSADGGPPGADGGPPGVDPTGETGTTPTPTPHVRSPVPVPSYSASSATSGPGGNAVGNGGGTASYANTQVIVAPTERAAADKAEWCRRNGRSQSSMDACMRAVVNR